MLINKYQPERPKICPDNGNQLMFRTEPRNIAYDSHKLYRTCAPANMLSQVELYRWTFDEWFTRQVSVADLHAYLVGQHEHISKRHMGMTLLNALDYEPRLLKGVSKENPKCVKTYVFKGGVYELRYGLEWMICAWYRRFLIDQGTRKEDLADSEHMRFELDLLGEMPREEYEDEIIRPLLSLGLNSYAEPDWRALRKATHLEEQERPLPNRLMEKPPWANL